MAGGMQAVAHALVVWLHPENKGRDKDIEAFTDTWEDYCEDNHLIVVAPTSEKVTRCPRIASQAITLFTPSG